MFPPDRKDAFVIKVFYSYAREDEADLKHLTEVHMRPLVWDGRIEQWLDRDISAGQEWATEIDANLEAADLIVLLLSSHFFASQYIRDVELKRALERQRQGAARLVPVLLRPVSRSSLGRLKDLQILPGMAEPVRSAASVDGAWVRVAEGIERAVDELTGLDGYPDDVARELRACRARLDPRDVDRHLRRRPVSASEKQELRSPRNPTGYSWPFQRGAIHWSARGGAHPVWGAIGAVHQQHGGCTGALGFPLTDEQQAGTSPQGSGGMYQRFEGGTVFWRNSDDTTVVVAGTIAGTFAEHGETAGPLGFPVSAEVSITSEHGTAGNRQAFEGGAAYQVGQRDPDPVQVVTGRLHDAHLRLGGVEGRYGFPTGPSSTVDDGVVVQEFEGGAITLVQASPVIVEPPPLVIAGDDSGGTFVALRDRRIVRRSAADDGWSVFHRGADPCVAATLADIVGGRRRALYTVDRTGTLRRCPIDDPSAWKVTTTPRPVRSIAAGSRDGYQEMLIAVDDGSVFHRWQVGGTGWSEWTWFPAPGPIRAVACACPTRDSVQVFAIDDEHRLLRRQYRPGDGWLGWESMDAPGQATALAVSKDARHLFVALVDGRVMMRWSAAVGRSDWLDYSPPSGHVVMSLATSGADAGPREPVADVPRHLTVFAATGAGDLIACPDGPGYGWGPWEVVPLPT